jgi:hypothetical protein
MNNFTHAWSNPILTGDIENTELVDKLVSHILTNYSLDSPPGEVNKQNILEDEEFIPFLKEIVEPTFDEYLKNIIGKSLYEFPNREYRAWITGAKNGYNILTHNHNGCQVSGVFYFYNDDPDAGGEIVLLDPRFNANRSYKSSHWDNLFKPIRMEAKSNSFVVFPSFIYHQTTPFQGKLRIAIPVDLFI